ncbi:sciellin isoform X2 [Talpa occidentalis]|uniref:sciellin isoform X2 n=1 Tax=Talpa occidentalis TaxID=50954 RepID=UPI0023F6301A|nr:sciellin isoform X2 [Talpa occidentalis]
MPAMILTGGSMSSFTLRKTPPTANDMKSTTRGTTLRQQGFYELNKRRAFLQDNSWIKKLPEEERDENYGRVVLNRHNSHDALDRKTNGLDEPKATLSRYRSDDTLDRISDRNDAVKTYKANTLDNRLTNRSLSTFKSPETTKKQPGGLLSTNTTNTSTSATTPVKKKRQSWFPPPPPGYNATPSTGAIRREPAVHPPIPPKPSSPVTSPHLLRQDNRQIRPPKPGAYIETNRSAERNLRSQDLENIVKVASSLKKTDKGEELDNIIMMNKSLSRNQGLDGLFRANPKTEQTEKRAKSLENLILLNYRMDKDGKGNQTLSSFIRENPRTIKNDKGNQDLGNLIKVNQRTDKDEKGKQDLNGHIKVNPEINKNIKRGKSLENLIKVTPEVSRNDSGSKDLDNLIKMNPRPGKSMQGKQDLENLIKEVPSAKKRSEQGLNELISVSPKAVKKMTGNQELDKLIKVNPEILTNNQRNQDLDYFIKVNPAVIRSNQSQDLDNLTEVRSSAVRNTKRNQDLENVIEINSNVSKHKNGRQEGHVKGPNDAVNNQPTRTTAYSYETKKNLSSNTETRNAGPKDTVVYTRTYVENSKSPKVGFQENVSGKYIQTVYSTSDRSVIERDMCTYCRKPLGTETKMILDELQICCHSTCFKCEICKQPLENLQAGDSIWIYRQTIHCEPCYSKVLAKWIQ